MPSASVKSRPNAILAPTSRKKFVVTTARRTCSGVPSSIGRTLRPVKTPAESWTAAVAPIDEGGIRERELPDVSVPHIAGGDHQASGVLIGKRAQQHSIGDTEDGGAGPDTQSDS